MTLALYPLNESGIVTDDILALLSCVSGFNSFLSPTHLWQFQSITWIEVLVHLNEVNSKNGKKIDIFNEEK